MEPLEDDAFDVVVDAGGQKSLGVGAGRAGRASRECRTGQIRSAPSPPTSCWVAPGRARQAMREGEGRGSPGVTSVYDEATPPTGAEG